MSIEISSKYNPSEVEDKWYKYWMEQGFFHSEPDNREPYTMVIPPPNVTGVLHMGHMLNNTIQDILVRRARMLGKNACWVPGTDHASIATEAKVVAKLATEGISKNNLSREEFLKHAWEWTHKHGGIILEQLKKLGASCDWERTCFTMDEKRSESVIKVFIDLYNKGLIYRGIRMVNWDPKAKTALSDEEVIHKEEHGKLFYLKYKVVEPAEGEGLGEAFAIVATTRPETIMGDTAMCINPNNPKTAWLKGKKVIIPLINREIPVIEDEYVDMEFGTGCLKVTPAHDVNDYMLGEKYNLEVIDIFNDDGTLNKYGLQYENMDRFEVRKQIETDLKEADLLEKIEKYTNKVGYSERTNAAIEPKLSMQWFLKMEQLAKPALEAVENDTIKFHPPKFKNMYRHWMSNVKDWCISRQLWWGHRIPAYYLPEGGFIVAENEEQAVLKACELIGKSIQKSDLRQDDDCLDTWFSSWLWPISVFDGINNPDNEEINYYYPTNDLVTAPEIIFFWVARMVMSGYEYRKEACFQNVYFTGIVRDELGRKMSKQLGNSPEPIELISKYGADGVRMGMLLTSPAGNDLPFDESLCEQGRNFNNKIWNAFRLIEGWEVSDDKTKFNTNSTATWWFDVKLQKTIAETDDLFSKYRLSEALMIYYKLFWDDFCAWYLEIIKPEYGKPIDRQTYSHTIYFLLEMLKRLHPFMPFITEELYQILREKFKNYSNIPNFTDTAVVALQNFVKEESIVIAQIKRAKDFIKNSENYSEEVLSGFEKSKEIITNVRNVRASKNISPKESLSLQIMGEHNELFNEIIGKLANVTLENVTEKSAGTVSFLVGTTEYAVPIGNLINVEEELNKLNNELKYLTGFLNTTSKKLANEKFVQNAKPEVVEIERRKLADTESKIKAIEEQIAHLK